MSLRFKLLLISILPVLLISTAALILISLQSQNLAEKQGIIVEQMIRSSKQNELKNYVQLARSAIEPFYASKWSTTPLAKEQVSNVMQKMTFGEDGYFFVYEADGTNIVHPRLPELVGKNWIDLTDSNGKRVINDLIDLSKTGGEFYEYVWSKPSTGVDAEKLGYSIYLDKWDWMIGSGLYIDDISAQIASMKNQLDENLNQTSKILFALTIGAVLLTGTLLTALRISEQRLANSRVQQMAIQVVGAQENERKRVSTELHDGISQLLVSARYGLDLAKSKATNNPSITEPIDKSMNAISTAIVEIRRISMALRPSILDDMGLAAALKSLGEDFAEQTAISVDINVQNVSETLLEEEKTTLYRIAQEALTNVVKHSNATKIWLELKRTKNHITLVLSDNGKGLILNKKDPSNIYSKNVGLGLGNMRERLQSHGGQLKLSNSNLGGLCVEAILENRESKRPILKRA